MGACLGKKNAGSKADKDGDSTAVAETKPETKPDNSGKKPDDKVPPKKKDGDVVKRKIEGAEEGDIGDKYDVGDEIGRGGFSVVCEATRKEDGNKFAVKIVEKTLIQEDIKLLKREIEIMKKVNHVNILKLIEIFEDDEHVYIVMELVDGSELFDRIVDKGYYSEKSTEHIVKQIL
jgi:serine/threonine protein kinase